jgi:hypothetical protein
VTLTPENGGVYRLDVSGVLRKPDLDRAQELLLSGLQQSGVSAARLLVVLEGFEGWAPDAGWNDLTFYIKHGDALTRIAIVGEERWRSYALMFAAADLRKGPVEYFLPHAVGEARAWLSQ